MSDKDNKDGYKEEADYYRDQLIAEVLLRITALENLLILKNVVSESEIQDQIKLLSAKIADLVSGGVISQSRLLTMEEEAPEEQEENVSESEFKQVFEEFALTTRKISKGN